MDNKQPIADLTLNQYNILKAFMEKELVLIQNELNQELNSYIHSWFMGRKSGIEHAIFELNNNIEKRVLSAE